MGYARELGRGGGGRPRVQFPLVEFEIPKEETEKGDPEGKSHI